MGSTLLIHRSEVCGGRAVLGASVGDRTPTRQEVIAFGGIADPGEAGLRSSARIRAQPNGEASTMERATALAARRDSMLDAGTGTKRKLSFVNLPNAVIISRASSLGVSLGCSKLMFKLLLIT